MTREVRRKVLAVRWHPTHSHKIQVQVYVEKVGGGKVKEWYTPLMRHLTGKHRLKLKLAKNPAGGFEYMERLLVGKNVIIPALQHEARGHGVKVDPIKPRDRKDLR